MIDNPVNGVVSFDVIIAHETSLLSRIYHLFNVNLSPLNIVDPERAVSQEVIPVIIFFHGGSFAHSSSNNGIYDILCRRLVGICKAVVVSVNYRRASKNRYPCAYDDGWTSLRWVNSRSWLKSTRDSNIHIYLADDSFGRNIEQTESKLRLDGKYFVTIQDWDWYWRAFLPDGEDRDHPTCNPFGPRGQSLEAVKFPKSLVVVAGLDLVQDWQLAYARGLESAGKNIKLLYLKQATIGFYLLPNNEHFYPVMDDISKFMLFDN
ncbi:hypothetical protein ACFX15_039293 [Malus domestica]